MKCVTRQRTTQSIVEDHSNKKKFMNAIKPEEQKKTAGVSFGKCLVPPASQSFIGQLALAGGRSINDTLAAEQQAALALGGITDSCLLPDELDDLLISPNLDYVEKQLLPKAGFKLSAAESEAMDHVRNCSFCQTLVRISRPEKNQRDHLLTAVSAARDRAEPPIQAPVLTGVQPAFIPIYSFKYWPLAIPMIGLVLLASLPLIPGAKLLLLAEGYSTNWLKVITYGIFGGGIFWLLMFLVKCFFPSRKNSISDNFGSTWPLLSISIGSLFFITEVSVENTKQLEKSVLKKRAAGASSAAAILSNPSSSKDFAFATSDFKQCRGNLALTQISLCSAVDGGSGEVVLELSPQKIELYWAVRGKKIEEIELIPAKIRKKSDGSTMVALQAGGETPVNTVSAETYADGENVIAVLQNGTALRLRTKDLPTLDENAGTFDLLRVSAVTKD
jgi:hypothetical protein